MHIDTCTQACVYIHTHVHTHIHTRTHTHLPPYIHTHTYLCRYIHTHICTSTHTHAQIGSYPHMFMLRSTYIHAQIHTHIKYLNCFVWNERRFWFPWEPWEKVRGELLARTVVLKLCWELDSTGEASIQWFYPKRFSFNLLWGEAWALGCLNHL